MSPLTVGAETLGFTRWPNKGPSSPQGQLIPQTDLCPMISDVKNITQLLQVNIKCKPEYEQNKFKITVYATALRLQDETEDSFDKPMILINPFFIIIGINNLALVSISIDTQVTCRRHAARAV